MCPPEPTPGVSLLWPQADDPRAADGAPTLSPACVADLDLDATISALSSRYSDPREIRAILLRLTADPAVIRYRQDALDDLLNVPGLAEAFEAILPLFARLERYLYPARSGHTALHEVMWRIGELENYVECVGSLGALFARLERPLASAGLRALRERILAVQRDPTYRQLVEELPGLLEQVRGIASVTIGVNLDEQLRPVEATLLAVNNRRFKGAAGSLFGMFFARGGGQRGAAQLAWHNPGRIAAVRPAAFTGR